MHPLFALYFIHTCVLQMSVSDSSPMQSNRLLLMHSRFLVLKPPEHVKEHRPHTDHSVHEAQNYKKQLQYFRNIMVQPVFQFSANATKLPAALRYTSMHAVQPNNVLHTYNPMS